MTLANYPERDCVAIPFFVPANGWDVSPCYDTVSKEIIPAIRNGMCWLVDREIIDKWIVKG